MRFREREGTRERERDFGRVRERERDELEQGRMAASGSLFSGATNRSLISFHGEEENEGEMEEGQESSLTGPRAESFMAIFFFKA